ncbi:hypothetical protein [uncultured Kordia sp.]|uniref:hypothetical protein n=1 Tax=uncultured Kordia sp. TaxID=507699 RepID=UPI00260EDC5B|nr:hypothetical protein [uncultured Kordia sp.]
MINYLYPVIKKATLFIFCLFSFSLTAQDAGLEILAVTTQQLQNNDEMYFYNGRIHLKDNTVLEGRVSINDRRYGEHFTVVRMKDSCKYIPNTKINAVIMYEEKDDVIIETKFEALDHGDKLYREIFYNEKKNITVYDSFERPFKNHLGYGVFVKENGVITNTYDFWTSGPKKDLINYINKRDKTKYKRRDFKTLQDLFDKL